MKLLSKQEAKTSLLRQNEELIDANVRLQRLYKNTSEGLAQLKDNYEPDKIKAKALFDVFCREITLRKSKLLKEYTLLDEELVKKKEIYYNFVNKQDAFEQKVYELNEREKKLDIRENFIKELEKKHELI